MPRFTKHILNKPEYVFRPNQIWRRILQTQVPSRTALAEVELPWGLHIQCHPEDVIGACIWRMGIYDLCVSEAIWRLLDVGEFAIDVGANIGHMTSLMACRVGKQGTVLALEPHPEIYKELAANVRNWQAQPTIAKLYTMPIALSSQNGEAALKITDSFSANRGTASLVEGANGATVSAYVVKTMRLDDVVEKEQQVGLMKIDVEGHEHSVLEGSRQHLQGGAIRDVIFEEHAPYPTPVTDLLEASGYTLFMLHKRLFQVVMALPGNASAHNPYEPPNYLATRDPERAKARLHGKGWAVLKAKR